MMRCPGRSAPDCTAVPFGLVGSLRSPSRTADAADVRSIGLRPGMPNGTTLIADVSAPAPGGGFTAAASAVDSARAAALDVAAATSPDATDVVVSARADVVSPLEFAPDAAAVCLAVSDAHAASVAAAAR